MKQQGHYPVLKKHKVLSGCDSCGRELCCLTFLNKPVEIDADILKKQGSGNRNKSIGICGKPKCCLSFEQ